MNERSIFSVSTGSTFRCASDDWPVPKSSMPMRTPRAASWCSTSTAPLAVLDEHGLVDLEHQQRRIESRGREHGLDDRDELGVVELAGREVDRDRERRLVRQLRAPACRLRARFVQDPRADRHDQAGLLRDLEEVGGLRAGRARGAPTARALRCRSSPSGRTRRPAGSARGTRRARARAASRSRSRAAARPGRASPRRTARPDRARAPSRRTPRRRRRAAAGWACRPARPRR